MGLSPDSVVYISGARSLLSGNGFSIPSYAGHLVPVVQYPPLFSACLATLGLAGLDPLEGARWLNLILFAANVTLVGLAVHVATNCFGASALSSLLTALSFPMVQVHSMAWSEPLFIFCAFLGLIFLALHMEARRPLVLIVSSVLVGLGFLTRYAGAAVVLTGVTGIFLLSKTPCRQKFVDAAIFSLFGCLPVVSWMARNLSVAGRATGREVGFHPPTWEDVTSAVNTISSWLLPIGSYPDWVSLVTIATLIVGIIFLMSRRTDLRAVRGRTRLPILLSLFVINHGLVLLITVSFFDAQTPLDNRVFSSAYLGFLVLAVCLSVGLLRVSKAASLAWISLTVGLLVFFLSHLERSAQWLEQSYKSGFGYASASWRDSKIIKNITSLNPSIPIFTNAPDAIYMLVGRSAFMIPRKINTITGQVSGTYADELVSMGRELEAKDGVLLYFNTVSWRWYLPSEDELKKKLGLRLIARREDGSIYQIGHGR